MTCEHALQVIDAGPFVDLPPARREAVRRHVHTCSACARAMEITTSLAEHVRTMPFTTAPQDLAARVMSRIESGVVVSLNAWTAETPDVSEVEYSDDARQPADANYRHRTRDRLVWVSACAAMSTSIALIAGASRVGTGGGRMAPAAGLAVLLYAAALFAPLHQPRRPRHT